MRRNETVQAVMSRDLITVGPGTPFKDIATLLAANAISAVPVVDRAGAPIGVVSEADLVAKARYQDRPNAPSRFAAPRRRRDWAKAQALTAAELMTPNPVVIGADAPLPQAARELAEAGVRRLLVVDDTGRLVGIVARRDVLRPFARDDEQILDDVRGEVLERALWLRPTAVQVDVTDGVATLTGRLQRRSQAEIAVRLSHAVPGVVAVRDGLTYELDDVDADLGTSNLLH